MEPVNSSGQSKGEIAADCMRKSRPATVITLNWRKYRYAHAYTERGDVVCILERRICIDIKPEGFLRIDRGREGEALGLLCYLAFQLPADFFFFFFEARFVFSHLIRADYLYADLLLVVVAKIIDAE